jgi:triacylglycerol lipase
MNIVLAHGILGFSSVGPVNYFNGLADHLRQKFQAKVQVPAIDPTAGTGPRSAMLRESIGGALSRGELDPSQPIHIIAHSMGGLDARRMIAEDPAIQVGPVKVPVKTLAMVGTPHRGSPIADLVAGEFVPRVHVLEVILDAAKGGLGDILGKFHVSLEGLNDLTTRAADDFNSHVLDNPAVKYLSYGGKGRSSFKPTSGFFLPFHAFIQLGYGEANDGVVPVSSARWTNFDEDLWPADHADEIGHDIDQALNPMSDGIRNRYDAIVAQF